MHDRIIKPTPWFTAVILGAAAALIAAGVQAAPASRANTDTHANANAPATPYSHHTNLTPKHSNVYSFTSGGASRTIDQAAHHDRGDVQLAQSKVNRATQVVNQMEKVPRLRTDLQKARGVFIVPDYGKGAAIVGGAGGSGVVLLHRNGRWSNPAFFNIAQVSLGVQGGGLGGSIAMLLMTPKAVNEFETQQSNFTVSGKTGLTVVTYQANAHATSNPADIIVWSDTAGGYAGASVSLTDITRNTSDNRAYYAANVTPAQIFSGEVNNPHSANLRQALAMRVASAK